MTQDDSANRRLRQLTLTQKQMQADINKQQNALKVKNETTLEQLIARQNKKRRAGLFGILLGTSYTGVSDSNNNNNTLGM